MLVFCFSEKKIKGRDFGAFFLFLKVGANEETLLQKHFELMLLTMLYGCANGKQAKMFCFRDANSASSRYVALVRKRGNIRETFKVNISSVFPKWFLVCSRTQHILKTQSLRLGSKKCFWNFPKTFFCVLDACLLPQKCLLVCAGLLQFLWSKTRESNSLA